jgi:hypothetical protein
MKEIPCGVEVATQCRGLTLERRSRPGWKAVHTHALQLALKRLRK